MPCSLVMFGCARQVLPSDALLLTVVEEQNCRMQSCQVRTPANNPPLIAVEAGSAGLTPFKNGEDIVILLSSFHHASHVTTPPERYSPSFFTTSI